VSTSRLGACGVPRTALVADRELARRALSVTGQQREHPVTSVEQLVERAERAFYGPLRSSNPPEVDLNRLAVHEAGHATFAWFSPHSQPILQVRFCSRTERNQFTYPNSVPAQVSILPTLDGFGYTRFLQDDRMIETKDTVSA